MKIAISYSPWLLGFRKNLEFANIRDDPRGLTGSEQALVRIAEEMAALGHKVDVFTLTEPGTHKGITLHPWEDSREGPWDVALSINDPHPLESFPDAELRVLYVLLNDWTFCKAGFENFIDLYISCSGPHLGQFMTNPAWHRVEVTPANPNGKVQWKADPTQWKVVPLGCDPLHYDGLPKVPGRVVYCSSPDRGLHWLLQQWPHIKRAVPHAHLKVFYRLQPWIDGFKDVAYFPPIERLRTRALYVEEALKRLSGPEWGIEVCDSVSRNQIEKEMAAAEVLAYPCDTTSWSEGFSCATLEGCAARACPVIFDCDALGSIYQGACVVIPRGQSVTWRDAVIRALLNPNERNQVNRQARAFAERHTWKHTAEGILKAINEHNKQA